MLYGRNPEASGIIVDFEDDQEVETVRSAFQEHALHLLALGSDSSVSDYQRSVIGRWEGPTRRYKGGSHRLLAERLRFFVEATAARGDEILDETDNPDRIADCARRYALGHTAAGLLESIEMQSSMDEELGEILGG